MTVPTGAPSLRPAPVDDVRPARPGSLGTAEAADGLEPGAAVEAVGDRTDLLTDGAYRVAPGAVLGAVAVLLAVALLSATSGAAGLPIDGVIASLLDIAGAVAGSYGASQEIVSVTINLNCSYMAPHQADTAIAEGELIRTTSSLFFSQAKLLDPENNRLCATATGTYKPKPRE